MMSFRRKLRRKIRSYKLRWLPFQEYLISSGFGFKIFLDIRKDVDRYFYMEEFEYQTLSFFEKVISKGSVVIDVGANIGIYSMIAARKTGDTGHVYAFEPSDWAYSRLNKNIAKNKLGNIIVAKVGVSEKSGELSFYMCEDDAYNSIGSSPMEDIKEVRKIQVISLDEFCMDKKIDNVDVIKIDTEGADYLVLKGAESILKNSDQAPIIFCEYNKVVKDGFDFSLENYRAYLMEMGYSLFEISNGELIEFDPENSKSAEVVCIKQKMIAYYTELIKK